MTFPLLALVVNRHAPEPLLPLLTALTAVCRPAALDVGSPDPAAALLSDASLVPPSGVPYAVWVDQPEDLPAVPAAAVVLTRDEDTLAAAGERGLWGATDRLPADVRPVTPFVRRRLRAARGLPASALLEQTGRGWSWCGLASLPDGGSLTALTLDADGSGRGDRLDSLLATASAAVVLDPAVALRSLAWGTPTVVDPATAQAAGLSDGIEVLVGADERSRRSLAQELAADDSTATMLARRGRVRVERRHDVDRTARLLAQRLGFTGGTGLAGSGRRLLDDLGTPPDARIRARLAEALSTTASERTP